MDPGRGARGLNSGLTSTMPTWIGRSSSCRTRRRSLEKAGAAADHEQVASLKSQISQLNASKESYGKIQALFDVQDPPVSRVFRRGDCFKPGIPVTRGTPEVLTPVSTGNNTLRDSTTENVETALPVPPATSGRRLELARWITSSENPITARVVMNRLWMRSLASRSCHAGEFWPQRSPTNSPGCPGLDGRRVPGKPVEPETHAPPGPDVAGPTSSPRVGRRK